MLLAAQPHTAAWISMNGINYHCTNTNRKGGIYWDSLIVKIISKPLYLEEARYFIS